MEFVLFDSRSQDDDIWIDSIAGGGFVTYNNSEVILSVGGSSGDKIIHETNSYFECRPKQEQRIIISAKIGTGKNNVVQSIGFGDSFKGLFFECIEGVMKITYRANGINERVSQVDWNIDPIDDIDWSTKLSFLINFAVDKIKFGLLLDDKPKYVHSFENIDLEMTSFPIRYELKNIGTVREDTILMCFFAIIVLEDSLIVSENKLTMKDRITTTFNNMVAKLKSFGR